MTNKMTNKVSKGGLIGGLIGGVASTVTYKKDDSFKKKAVKTGIFAGLGFILGYFIEKMIKSRRNTQ